MIASKYTAHVLIYTKESLPTGNCLKTKQYTVLINSTCIITQKQGTRLTGKRDLLLVRSALISFPHSLKNCFVLLSVSEPIESFLKLLSLIGDVKIDRIIGLCKYSPLVLVGGPRFQYIQGFKHWMLRQQLERKQKQGREPVYYIYARNLPQSVYWESFLQQCYLQLEYKHNSCNFAN